MLSRSQVDRVGDRLRQGDVDEHALTKLSEYQSEFDLAYKYVEKILTKKLYLTITGRPAKSTLSVIEKLRRINSRLSQIQDMSGCRAIVHNLSEQDEVIKRAREWFPHMEIDDKRELPTHGYRAVHLLIYHGGKCVEVQIRTRIQHFWATISEKLSDMHGQDIKYGQGSENVLEHLRALSDNARHFDVLVAKLHATQQELINARRLGNPRVRQLSKSVKAQSERMRHVMYEARAILIKMEGENVLSD